MKLALASLHLPRMFAGRRLVWWFGAWLALVLLLPLPFVARIAEPLQRLVDVRTHAIVELFCAVTALLIAGLIWALSNHYYRESLRLFAAGFAVMGALDLLHAASHPVRDPNWFVASHTLSIFLGSVLLFLAAVRCARTHRLCDYGAGGVRFLRMGAAGLIGAALVYHLLLPRGGVDELYSFSLLARAAHEIAGLLYAVAAVLAILLYRSTGQRLVLVSAGMLLLFAQSAFLFRFSHVWDSTWWVWHGVKVAFYTGTLFIIAAGLVVALRAADRARADQTAANRELRRTHRSLARVYDELQVRNELVRSSIGAVSLEQTLPIIARALRRVLGPCTHRFVLQVGEDETGEWRRDLERRGLSCDFQVIAGSAGAAGEAPPPLEPVSVAADRRARVELPLQAHGCGYGSLHVQVNDRARLSRARNALDALAAEVGPILHNALLHHRWEGAIAFRSALARVAGLVSSSLELQTVLASLCRESAQLLDSDAAAVFMAHEAGGDLHLASRCLLDPDTPEHSDPHWLSEPAAQTLMERLRVTRRPLALIKPASGAEDVPFPLNTARCPWGAIAMFPMIGDGRLLALMLIARRPRIAFSADTLERGELLAEQARVAIANARAYEALRETNERLRRAEGERVRAERLAVLGQMAASVAHEIRNPLSAINNCLAVLRRAAIGRSSSISAVEIIDDEVQRLERLTRNFLSFGRAPQRRPTTVVLQALARRVCDGVAAHIHHEGLDVHLTLDADDGMPVSFDADGLQEVLWNLLLNAAQASEGRGRVRVRLRQYRDAFFLAVADDGPGVPRSERDRIFDPFHSRRSHGAGLGLAIVRQHLDAWGARLRIWGPPGACFALRCPIPVAKVAVLEARQ